MHMRNLPLDETPEPVCHQANEGHSGDFSEVIDEYAAKAVHLFSLQSTYRLPKRLNVVSVI